MPSSYGNEGEYNSRRRNFESPFGLPPMPLQVGGARYKHGMEDYDLPAPALGLGGLDSLDQHGALLPLGAGYALDLDPLAPLPFGLHESNFSPTRGLGLGLGRPSPPPVHITGSSGGRPSHPSLSLRIPSSGSTTGPAISALRTRRASARGLSLRSVSSGSRASVSSGSGGSVSVDGEGEGESA
jgi:hypothetical protein